MSKPNHSQHKVNKNPQMLDKKVLLFHKGYATFVLINGQELDVRILELNQFNLYCETEFGKIWLPKHSILYGVIERGEKYA